MPKLTDWDRKCQTVHGITVKKDRKRKERYKKRILRLLGKYPRRTYGLVRFINELRIREHTPRGGLNEFFDAVNELKVSDKIVEYPHPKYQGSVAYRLNKESKPT